MGGCLPTCFRVEIVNFLSLGAITRMPADVHCGSSTLEQWEILALGPSPVKIESFHKMNKKAVQWSKKSSLGHKRRQKTNAGRKTSQFLPPGPILPDSRRCADGFMLQREDRHTKMHSRLQLPKQKSCLSPKCLLNMSVSTGARLYRIAAFVQCANSQF